MWGPALFSALLTMVYAYVFCNTSRSTLEEYRLGLLRDIRADIRDASEPGLRCAHWMDHTPCWVTTTPLVQASWDETVDWCAWIQRRQK
jgi:hypothetical protein